MEKTITICDSCGKEYTKGQYGDEGILELKLTSTNSCPEKKLSKLDLCSACFSKAQKSIEDSLNLSLPFKSQGMGVWY